MLNFFQQKDAPLRLLGYFVAIRAIALGASFAFSRPDAVGSVLYGHLLTFPYITPEIFGWLLLISGVLSGSGYLINSRVFVKYASEYQFMVLLFATFIYLVHGSILSGIIAGLVPAFITAVVSMSFYFKKVRVDEDEERKYFGI